MTNIQKSITALMFAAAMGVSGSAKAKVFASGRVVAADFNNGVVVTQGVSGQMRAFNFDPATLVTKP